MDVESPGEWMLIPFGIFWLLLFLARGELGFRGVAICAAIGAALLAGILFSGLPWPYFVVVQVVLDVVLILKVFGVDIRIN